MLTTTTRRLAAALFAPALAAGVIAAAPSAQAAPNPAPAATGASWLAGQLPSGSIPVTGASLDALIAFKTLGLESAKATEIVAAFAADPTAYTTGKSFDVTGSQYAGPIAKLATVVTMSGGDPESFGSHDLLDELTARTVDTGDEAGRATDISQYGDNSNTTGQSFVVRALETADSTEASAALAYLLNQQCEDGSFRGNMFSDGSGFSPAADRTCGDSATASDDEISIDATAAAGLALVEARDEHNVSDLDDEIASAVAWLEEEQNDDGSFTEDVFGTPTTNANSTGLTGYFLGQAGAADAAEKAAGWIVGNQIKTPAPSKLADEVGAIAYTTTDYDNGVDDGIVPSVRAQWARATGQGLLATPLAQSLTVTAPISYVRGGSSTTVTVAGLPANGAFTVVVAGKSTAGTANASGTGTVKVTPPAGTSNRVIVASSTTAPRKGTAPLKVLGPKKVSPKLKYTSVKRGKSQTVTVSGLAPSEPLEIKYSSISSKSGKATSSGKYSYTFKVGSKKGTKTVRVTGAFSNRTGTKTFKVK